MKWSASMAPDIRVEWDGGEATAASTEELDALLDRLDGYARATEPFVVEVYAESGDVLGIGLGEAQTVLLWSPAALEQPQLTSRGSGAPGAATFRFSGRPVAFREDQLIPREAGREAVRRFAEIGSLTDDVEWQPA